MKLSLKWLSDFVDLGGLTPKEFADGMTMSGTKAEGWEDARGGIEKVVIGRVLEIAPHPDADRLTVCKIDIGTETLQIVTGAKNLTAGDTVPVATNGSTIAGGVKIKSSKMRGVDSNGMLCSLTELGLTLNDFPYATMDGIFVLQEDGVRLGQDAMTALGLDDVTVEFEITSNRPDCLSVLGLAREAAVTFDKQLKLPKLSDININRVNPVNAQSAPLKDNPQSSILNSQINSLLSVEVLEQSLCPRYLARMVTDVKIAPSPRWLRERLRASGIRPINNLVDITNYVCLEYGHPMHAFDYRFLKGQKIVVRRAKPGEKIVTLDGVERELTSQMLAICDAEKPNAVAGIMGGEYSGVMEDTAAVVFEAACFEPGSIRATAQTLCLRTDSSARFEKGLSPTACEAAMARALELVELLGAGKVVGGEIDRNFYVDKKRALILDPAWINGFLGTQIEQGRMEDILTRLEFEISGNQVTVPYFRADVEDRVDIAEEIARIIGYDNIKTTQIRGSAQGARTEEQKFERTLTQAALALGYTQAVTYSFVSPKVFDRVCLPVDSPLRNAVRIKNPLGEDTSVMRTTALPSILSALAHNYNNRNQNARLFELATEYFPTGADTLPEEKRRLILAGYGRETDFFALKGAVEALLISAGISETEFSALVNRQEFHPGRCAEIFARWRGQTYSIGVFGQIHPDVAANFGLPETSAALLDFQVIFKTRRIELLYSPLPKFPAITRDLAVVTDAETPVGNLKKAIYTSVKGILESVKLFDVYTGSQIESGKKSAAFSVVFRAKDRTLTDAEADKAMERILDSLEKLGAKLR